MKDFGELLKATQPTLDLAEAYQAGAIVYFALPVARFPETAPLVAKLIISDLNSVAGMVQDGQLARAFASIVIDEFAAFAMPLFVDLLNKGREVGRDGDHDQPPVDAGRPRRRRAGLRRSGSRQHEHQDLPPAERRRRVGSAALTRPSSGRSRRPRHCSATNGPGSDRRARWTSTTFHQTSSASCGRGQARSAWPIPRLRPSVRGGGPVIGWTSRRAAAAAAGAGGARRSPQVPAMSPAAGRSPAISACGGGDLAQSCELVLGRGNEHVANPGEERAPPDGAPALRARRRPE